MEVLTVNGWCAGGMGWGWVNGEMNVQSMGEMGKDFYPNFLQPFLENIEKRICNDGSWELIPFFSQPSPKMQTFPFGSGSQLGVPSRGPLLGRVELEGRKTSSDQYPKGL